MKFSIVITTYNRLSLLKRAIQSALSQTLPCEVVVVDNNSSDQTETYVRQLIQILNQIGDYRLVYYRNSANLGHSGAMNVGVKQARGHWIKPIDDDDYLAPNCLEVMAQAIALHPEAAICSCQAAQVYVDETEISRTRKIGDAPVCYVPQEDLHYGMLLEDLPFGTPIQVAFRRDAFLESGGWDPNLDVCDDADSWIKLAQYGDAIFINQCLTYRTIWPGGYNQKSTFQQRLEVNVAMKEKIRALVSLRHQGRVPTLARLRSYLQLHWGLVALKQGKLLIGLQVAGLALVSGSAWKLLFQVRYWQQRGNPSIRMLPLVRPSAPKIPTVLVPARSA